MVKDKSPMASTTPVDNTPSLVDLISGPSITTTKLCGNIFLQSSAAITTFLISKDKLHYVEDVSPKEVDLVNKRRCTSS